MYTIQTKYYNKKLYGTRKLKKKRIFIIKIILELCEEDGSRKKLTGEPRFRLLTGKP